MRLPLDRPARHRAAGILFRLCRLAVLAAAVNEFPPTKGHDFIRIAIAYLACLILAMILFLVAVLHDLVAATLRPKFWFTSLRAGDREITHGGGA